MEVADYSSFSSSVHSVTGLDVPFAVSSNIVGFFSCPESRSTEKYIEKNDINGGIHSKYVKAFRL